MITFAVLLLFGMLGLVVDVGWSYYTLQVAQTAADSGAMAAALAAKTVGAYSCSSLGCATTSTDCSSVSNSTALYSACQYASTNGFSSGGMGGKQTVKVLANVSSTPPNSSTTAKYWVQVVVTQSMPQLFSAVLGNTAGKVSAAATAAVLGSTGGSGGCVYILDPSDSDTLFDTGQGTLSASCGVKIASTNAQAVHVNGCSHVVGGAITIGGSYKIDDTSCSTVVGTPLTTNQGSSCCSNPLSAEPIPSAVSNKQNCDHTGQYYIDQNSNNNVTLSPGVYCGGIMDNGGTVTFSPGTYILNGGGLTIQNSSKATGAGVTFFNTAYTTTNNAYTGTYGGFTLSDSIVSVNFSAPTSGSLMGMLFYQDPSIPVGKAGSQIQARAATVLQGTIYLPTTTLTYTGEAATSEVVGMVVYKLTMNGNSSFTINTDSDGTKTGLGGSGTTTVSLLQ